MSKKLKLSPWHDGSVKPVYEGVYQRDYSNENDESFVEFCYFNGEYFGCGYSTIEAAYRNRIYKGVQCIPWRGVLK